MECDFSYKVPINTKIVPYNLAMVAGSDRLLRFLDRRDEDRVRALVRPSRKHNKDLRKEGWFECDKQYSSLLRGATYKVYALEGFSREIWICPVTLTVLGHYPKYIYIKQMPLAYPTNEHPKQYVE